MGLATLRWVEELQPICEALPVFDNSHGKLRTATPGLYLNTMAAAHNGQQDADNRALLLVANTTAF